MTAKLAGAPILVVDDNPAMARLLETATRDGGGKVAGRATNFADALDLVETLPVAAALIPLFANGIRCDEIAAELTRRSVPFAVTAGLDCERQPQTPRDAQHFQIRSVVTLLGDLLHGSMGLSV